MGHRCQAESVDFKGSGKNCHLQGYFFLSREKKYILFNIILKPSLVYKYGLSEPYQGWFILQYFLKDFIYLFLERGEGEREGEKHQCVVASHAPTTGDLAHNPGMCPDWELN